MMTQTYDRFAGQNLAVALAAVRAESLQPPAGYVSPNGRAIEVANEGQWAVLQSAPGGAWVIAEIREQPVAAPVKQPLTAAGLIAILVGLAVVVFIVVSFMTH